MEGEVQAVCPPPRPLTPRKRHLFAPVPPLSLSFPTAFQRGPINKGFPGLAGATFLHPLHALCVSLSCSLWVSTGSVVQDLLGH